MPRYTAEKNLDLSVVSPLDSGDTAKFVLQHLEGEEGLSQPFCYTLKLSASDNAVDFSKLVEKTLTVKIRLPDASYRTINGQVTWFKQAESDELNTIYYAEIRPWISLLELTLDAKIFQSQTVPDILKAVFQNYGFSDFRDDTKATYEARDYCVQYQESAYHFVCRLMEEEGIFFFFEHSDSKHTLVLNDDSTQLKDCPGLSEAWSLPPGAAHANEQAIVRCALKQQVVSNQYLSNDYSFETPSTNLSVSVDGQQQGKLSVYEYPGRYLKTNEGQGIAKTRIEGLESLGSTLEGESNYHAMMTGYAFTLKNHPRSDMNQAYVLKYLKTKATPSHLSNSFIAIPKATPFRPPRIHNKPTLAGTQTAVVVGTSGEEIYTDKYGRIKVQFHWDRDGKSDENSSCWIRVAQMWAGKAWGSFFLPRIGSEVVVSFVDNDIDRPLVTGTVYNAVQTTPLDLPSDQNKSTILSRSTKEGEAGNQISFDDTKDSELFYLHAQKDYSGKVENNSQEHVVKNRQVFLQSDDPEADDSYQDLLIVEGQRKIQVKGDEESHLNDGKFTQEVTKEFLLNVKGDSLTIQTDGDLILKGKTISLTSTEGDITLSSETNITAEASQDATLKAKGGDLLCDASANLDNKAGSNLTNKAGSDLTNDAGMNLTNKAGMNLENNGSVKLTNKGGASQDVDGGGMLNLKGGLIKMN